MSCDVSCDLQDEKSLHDLLDELRKTGGVGLANGHSEEDMKKWPIAKVREREKERLIPYSYELSRNVMQQHFTKKVSQKKG